MPAVGRAATYFNFGYFGILTMVDNFLFLTLALMRQVKSVGSGSCLSEPGLGFALSTPSSEHRKLHKFYALVQDMKK